VSNGENNAKVLVTKDEGATYTTLASFTGAT